MSRTKPKKSSHTFFWLKIVSVVLVPFLALWILPGLDEYRPSNAGSTGLTLTSVDIEDDYLKVQFSTTMNTDNYLYFKEIGSTNFISGRDMGDQGGVHRFDTDPNNNTLIPGTEYEFYIRSEETGNTTNFDEIGSSASPHTIFTVGSVANTFTQFNHATTTPSIAGAPSTIEALFLEDITIADTNQITLNETSPTFGNITISTTVINSNTVEITPSSALNIGSTYQVTYIATQNALEYANTISGIQPSVETPGLIFDVLTGTPDIDVQNDASGTLATVTHNTTADEIPFTVVTVGDTEPTQTIRVLNTNGTAALTPTLSFPASNTCVVGLQFGSSLDASIAVGQHDEFILELDTILADSFDNSECSLSINSNASPSPYTIFFSGTVNAASTLNVVGTPEIRLNNTEFEIIFETNIATDVELYLKTANGTFAGTATDTSNNQTTHTLGKTNLTEGIDYEYYIDIVENGNSSNNISIADAATPNTFTTFTHPFTPADGDINVSQTLGSIIIDFGEEIENVGGGAITSFANIVEFTDNNGTTLAPTISIDGNNQVITLDINGITLISGDDYTVSILENTSGEPTIQTRSSGSNVGILATSSTFTITSAAATSDISIAYEDNGTFTTVASNSSADTIPLGTVNISDAVTQTIRVSNNGTADLTGAYVSIPLNNSCKLSQPASSSLDGTIGSGLYDDFILELDTSSVDNFSAADCAVYINSNDPNISSYILLFSGIIQQPTGPEISITTIDGANNNQIINITSGGSIDFDSVLNNGMTVSKILIVKNIGTSDLIFDINEAYAFNPSTNNPFSINAGLPTNGQIIGTQDGTVINIELDASNLPVGALSGHSISLNTNDVDENPFIINLDATITTPTPEIDIFLDGGGNIDNGGNLDFGIISVSGGTIKKDIRIENNGPADLIFNSNAYNLTPSSNTPFSVTSTNPTSSQIISNDIIVRIELDPANLSSGTINGYSISFNTNDPDESTYTINLTGSISTPGGLGFKDIVAAVEYDDFYVSISTTVDSTVTLYRRAVGGNLFSSHSSKNFGTNADRHHKYKVEYLSPNTDYEYYIEGVSKLNLAVTELHGNANDPKKFKTLDPSIFNITNSSTGVNINQSLEINFDETVSLKSTVLNYTDATILFVDSPSVSAGHSGSNITGNDIIVIPSNTMNYNSWYRYGVLTNTIKLSNGVFVAGINSSFHTSTNNPAAPTVAISPTGTNNPVTTNITLTFSEAVRRSNGAVLTGTTVDSLVVLKKTNSSGATVTFDATINSAKNIITINPTGSLEPNTTYYVEVPNNFENSSNVAVPVTTATFKTAIASNTINISILEEDADDDKITIDYSTDISTTATVIYSRNSNFTSRSSETVTSRGLINGKYEYRFVLDNLRDDTKYYYQITATDGTDIDVYDSNEKTDDDDGNSNNDEDDVYITEIMYHPDDSDEPEWIEIYNDTGDDTDFEDWYIEIDGTRYTFVKAYEIDDDELNQLSSSDAFEVEDGEYFVLTYDIDDFEDQYDNDFDDYDNEYDDTKVFELSRSLDISDSGEEIELFNDDDDDIDEVDFDDDWGNEDNEDDGDGYSLEKIDFDGSDTDSNWDTSIEKGGTPGRDNDVADDDDNNSSSSGNLSISFSNIRVDADNNDFRVKFNTSTSASTRVYYGTTESVTKSVTGSSSGTSHDIVVSGLTKNTTYYYQLYASKNGRTKRSDIFNISTSDSSTDTGIDLQNIEVTSITKSSARVVFKTDISTDTTITYSKTRSDLASDNKPQWIASFLSIPQAIAQAVQTATSDNKTNHAVSLNQLEPYTTYYYQIEAKYGTKLANSSVLSFRTANGTGGSSSSSFSRSSSSSISRSSSSSTSTGAQAIIRNLPKLVSRRVAFDATPSRNIPNGSKFEWDFDSSNGTTQVDSTGRITHHTYPKDSNYTVTLTVKDANGRIIDTATTTAPVKSGQAASTTRLPQTGYASYAVIIALIAGVFYVQKYWIHKIRKKKTKTKKK